MRIALAGFFLTLWVAAATPAAASQCDIPEEIVFALTAPEPRVDGEPVLGRSAYACGRYWSSANLLERAVQERSSSLQRFNLAASYARTGRYDAAEALYGSVIADGDFVRARMDSSAARPEEREGGFGLAEEAARRVAAMRTMKALFVVGSASSTANVSGGPGPIAADARGANAGALESAQGYLGTASPSTPEVVLAPAGPVAAEARGVDAGSVERQQGEAVPSVASGRLAAGPAVSISNLEALRRDALIPPQ